jgi:hypothetical protein
MHPNVFRRSVVAMLLMAVMVVQPLAQGKVAKPLVPPGKPTKGFAVAIMADGFDYTRPAVAAKFARDGEGDAIAFDAVDDDRQPFGRDATVSRLTEMTPSLVVPIRVDASLASWQRGLAFVHRSPARVIVILSVPSPDAWAALQSEMKGMPDRLFIVPADPARAKTALDHVLTVAALPAPPASTADLVLAPAAAAREAPGGAHRPPVAADQAAVLAAGLFTCTDVSAARSPAAVKALFLSKAARSADAVPPLLEVCP